MVRRLAEARPEVLVYAGIANRGTARLLARVVQPMPGVPLYASSGLLDREPGRVLPLLPALVRALGPMPPSNELPPRARRLSKRLSARGSKGERPEALYGYEACG